ncbi:MAG: hypothetical protein AAB425_02245 [Bdellovibrionota bacterium]
MRIGILGNRASRLIGLGVILLVSGIWTGGVALRTAGRPSGDPAQRLRHPQDLALQARIYTDSIWTALDGIKTRVMSMNTASSADLFGESIYHWSVPIVRGGKIQEYARTGLRPGFVPVDGGVPEFERRLTSQLNDQLRMEEIQRPMIFPFKPDPGREQLWMVVLYPHIADAAAGAPEVRLLAAVIDPAAAFAAFRAPGTDGEVLRSYVINSDGYVFAHTHAGYVGSTFASAGVFSQVVRSAFLQGKPSLLGEGQSLDRTQVQASFERVGSLPIGVVVEIPVAATAAGQAWLPFVVSAPLGGIFFALGFVAFYLAWRERMRVFENRHKPDTRSIAERMRAHVASQVETPKPDPIGLPVLAAPQPMQSGLNQMSGIEQELRVARDALKKAQEEIELVSKFEAEGARSRDPVRTSMKLTELANRLSESPALFFSVHEAVGSAVLEASAGFPPGGVPNLGTLSFPLDEALLDQVAEAEGRGQITSVAGHLPLGELIMTRFGVAHFEAWPIIGYGYFGRILAKPRILGILVLLQPSTAARQRRETIERALRSTGLVYENALLSQ